VSVEVRASPTAVRRIADRVFARSVELDAITRVQRGLPVERLRFSSAGVFSGRRTSLIPRRPRSRSLITMLKIT
jgi:hypothetical protein